MYDMCLHSEIDASFVRADALTFLLTAYSVTQTCLLPMRERSEIARLYDQLDENKMWRLYTASQFSCILRSL